MTAHGAKGLEFKHVFIIQCVEGNWGGNKSRESIKLPAELFDLTGDKVVGANSKDLSMEDERRLFFVALTRSKEHIYITLAEKYPSGTSTTNKAPRSSYRDTI
jgi:superfamily I DNA/RNA helicase